MGMEGKTRGVSGLGHVSHTLESPRGKRGEGVVRVRV